MCAAIQKDTTSTFIDNMSLPIHRWFRYSAGFSAQWVEETVMTYLSQSHQKNDFKVLDPFAGSGNKSLTLNVDNLGIWSFRQHLVADRLHQVGFTKPHAPEDEQGVVEGPRVVGNRQSGSGSQFVALALNEVIEGVLLV